MNEQNCPGRVGVVCNDAGGAEVVSSYIKRSTLDCMYCLSGPAIEIFRKKLGFVDNVSLKQCLNNIDWLLCSMGWSDHEWEALTKAKEMGKQTVVFLDHWTGYVNRFMRDGMTQLPDEVWVGDLYAKEIALKVLPHTPIKFVPNPYYADLMDELELLSRKRKSRHEGINILYVCEPTAPLADLAKSSGYTEHEALRYFLEYLKNIDEEINSIIIRPHPTETIDKYSWVLEDNFFFITMSDTNSLMEDVVNSDWVVGRNSMALVIGLLAGKRSISCIPPGGKPCSLPQKEILHF